MKKPDRFFLEIDFGYRNRNRKRRRSSFFYVVTCLFLLSATQKIKGGGTIDTRLFTYEPAVKELRPMGKFFEELDLALPFCEQSLSVSFPEEYFFEVTNQVKGIAIYNELIRYYKRKSWAEFEQNWAIHSPHFHSLHRSLQEALPFLEVQVKLEQLSSVQNEEGMKEVENLFRKASIDFPESKYIGALIASLGEIFLKWKMPQKAMGLYEYGLRRAGTKGMACALQTGVAESYFILENFTVAEEKFLQALSSCTNPKLRAMNLLRLSDIAFLQEKPEAEKKYKKVLDEFPQFVNRYFPTPYLQLGEIFFGQKKWAEAKAYFIEFRRNAEKKHSCQILAAQRLADLSLRIRPHKMKSIGVYLSVFEEFPQEDFGRFSLTRALLLGFSDAPMPDQERRIKRIDEEVSKIKSKKIQEKIFLEKGLALLEAGDARGISYLEKMRKKLKITLEEGITGQFIRQQLLQILQKEIQRKNNALGKNFEALESAFDFWFRGTEFEQEVRELTEDLVLNTLEEVGFDAPYAVKQGITVLKRWHESILWQPEFVRDSLQEKIHSFFLSATVAPRASRRKTISPEIFILKEKELLEEVLEEKADLLFAYSYGKLGDFDFAKGYTTSVDFWNVQEKILEKKEIKQEERQHRGIALFELAHREGNLSFLKKYVFTNLFEGDDSFFWIQKTLSLLEKKGEYSALLTLVSSHWNEMKEGDKKQTLSFLLSALKEAKKWETASLLFSLAKTVYEKEEKAQIPFSLFQARNFYEQSHYKEAIALYEKNLKGEVPASEVAEANYFLGKSLLYEKLEVRAKEIFQKTVSLKDPFFTSLAQLELKLLP